jgi:hypothetical protein
MKQRAHAWTALRALKYLDDSGQAPELVELLSYYLSDIWEGAWLPDTLIIDMAYGHIYKMETDKKIIGHKLTDPRATVKYKDLRKKLAGKRLCLEYVKDSPELNKSYWSQEGHLPNRVISLSHIAGDMMKMSDYPLTFYAQKEKPKDYQNDLTAKNIKDLSLSPNFSARQIALVFFILSHYICDVHMPLHCDLRDYGGKIEGNIAPIKVKRRLPKELHPSIEEEWENYFPEKEFLALNSEATYSIGDLVIKKMPTGSPIKIDTDKKYALDKKIPKIVRDEWEEMVMVGRTSYALAKTWLDAPYKDASDLMKKKSKEEFYDVTNRIFHDAVQDIAAIWLKAWERYIK